MHLTQVQHHTRNLLPSANRNSSRPMAARFGGDTCDPFFTRFLSKWMEPNVPADRLEAIQTVGLLADTKRAQAFRMMFSKIFHISPENIRNPLTPTERDALVEQFKSLPDADKRPLFTVAQEMQKLFASHLALGSDTVDRLEKLLPPAHA